MDNAIKPNFFSNIPSFKRDSEAKKKGATEEERLYYGMSQTAGWKQFEELARQLLVDLDDKNDESIASGMTVEEVGKNAIVISLTKGIVKRLLNVVLDAKEVCEQPAGGK